MNVLAMVSMKLVLNPILIKRLQATLLFAWVVTASMGYSAHACKYSVRDVAFVDLTQESYAFLTLSSSSDLEELKVRIQPVATAVFLDSNIRVRDGCLLRMPGVIQGSNPIKAAHHFLEHSYIAMAWNRSS
jgi:hypothetical protein